MKNIYSYILFIIIGTFNHRLGIHAQRTGEKENFVFTKEYFEQEGRSDVENLLPGFKIPRYDIVNDVKKDDKTATDFKRILEQLRLLQRSIQFQQNQARRNLPYGYVPNADDKNRFYKVMRQLATSQDNPTIKNIRMNTDEKFLDGSLRKSFRNINPKLYRKGTTSNGRTYDRRETSLRADNVHNLRHSYKDKELNNFMKSSKEINNTFQTYEPLRNRNHLPLSANLEQFNELLNRFNENSHIKRRRSRKNEPDNDVLIPFLRTSNSPTRAAEEENLDAINDLHAQNSKQTTLTVLRTDLSDETMRADINDKIDKFVNHFDEDKNERITNRRIQDAELDNGRRTRRSTRTQAGYTQDPDTCKTYNENLVKLWSNLSKYINVTEQPDDLALHNIAMMVQAYLEHHTIQTPEIHKTKQEAPRDKVTEILLRIRKTLEDNQASVEKIVKIIKKYTKPFYGDVENEDCQQDNEEYLQSSVNSHFKNYQNNLECTDEEYDDIGMNMNKRLILRNLRNKSLKPSALSNSDMFKPDKNTYFEGDLFEDSHSGKVPNQRPSRYRRLSQRDRKRKDRAPTRSSRIDDKKSKTRKSLRESSKTRSHKNYVHSDGSKSRCKRAAIRKLTIALRPVIERFTLLLECQVDNTLRTELDYRNSRSPHYLYASKYFSGNTDENYNHREPLPIDRLTRKNTELSNIFETSRTEKRHDTSSEPEKDDFVRDDGYTWIKKQSDSQVKLSETEDRKSDATNDFDYIATDNDLRSPPIYDDYDDLVKTPVLNLRPILTIPLTSKMKKKRIKSKLNNKFTRTQQDQNVYVAQGPVTTPKPPGIDYDNYDENINLDNVEPFQDLTRLRQADEFRQGKKYTHTYESLSELLQKARDVSLQTPEVAIPFALDVKKGYVELTYLVKYPKMVVYRPQSLVKNIMPFDEFVKTISNFNMTNNDVRLMKIVRHFPDESVKVLFETEDYEEPLQIHDINENKSNIRTVWKNRRLSVLDNIGSIINQLMNKIRQKSRKSNNKEFSSDTSTVVTTPTSNPLHDTSSFEFKPLSSRTGLDDNILAVNSSKSKLSEVRSHTNTGQTLITNITSESRSSQDASNYSHSVFLKSSERSQALPNASSKPKHSVSSVAIGMWTKLRTIIQDEIKKILGHMADVGRNIEKLTT